MSRNHAPMRGFTLIELMLAMTFVSFLLVGIALLTIQMSTMYTRGLTMKEVNQAGTEVADDMRRTISESPLRNVQATKKGDNFVLCTGSYSYITNGSKQLESGGSPNVKFFGSNTPVRLAKVRDISASYCTTNRLNAATVTLEDGAVELLGGGDRSLVVRKLSLDPVAGLSEDSLAGRMLFTVRLTLSTGVDDEIENDTCRAPDDEKTGGEYCAINTFVIVARVGNT
jgi:Tfp pilus assembly protein PilV